jgi:dihydroorotase
VLLCGADDMATAMTKMLAVGMPIASVIAAATTTPAKTIGWGDRIGSLEPGMAADIAVLELQETGQQGEGGGAENALSEPYI